MPLIVDNARGTISAAVNPLAGVSQRCHLLAARLVGGPLGRLLVQGGAAYHERLQPSETADRFTVSLAHTRWSGTASPAERRSVPPACRSRATGRSAAFLPSPGLDRRFAPQAGLGGQLADLGGQRCRGGSPHRPVRCSPRATQRPDR